MSSPDHHSPWGTPQSPSGAAGGAQPPFGPGPDAAQPPYLAPQSPSQDPGQPAPPPMMSPYGMPLSGGGPEGPGGHGPGDGGPGGPGPSRRALIVSALAVVAVVGVGGTVAYMNRDTSKPDKASLAGAGASVTASPSGGDGAAVIANGGGKPDGDSMAAGPSSNGAQGVNVPDSSTAASSTATGGQPGQTATSNGGGTTTTPGGHPVTSTHPGSPATSAPGAPAPSHPAPSASKPNTPVTTAAPPKPSTAAAPSSDCTYLDLPASQMPTIKQGSGNVNAVKQLQCLLKKSELGIKPLVIDGSWGADTQSAMTAFQGCNNSPTVHSPGGTPPYPKLSVDGVAGPQTWADLYFWDNQYFNGTAYYCNGTR